MKRVDFKHMEIVKNYANKSNDFIEQEISGDCYTCDSEGCDGGPCDCDDGGYQD